VRSGCDAVGVASGTLICNVSAAVLNSIAVRPHIACVAPVHMLLNTMLYGALEALDSWR
jgi:hypothetical protein